MISLLPMAGRGSRFSQDRYALPKPFIPVMGMPMFLAAIHSFPRADGYILICLEEFLRRYTFKQLAENSLPNCRVLSVKEVTEGQACTCLLAESLLDPNEALMISSCDYQLVYDEGAYQKLLDDQNVDVIIWTFKLNSLTRKNPSAFAYCRMQGDHVVEVVEKRPISDNPSQDPAVVGTFYYRRARDFATGAKSMIANGIRVNGEFYVATSINQLIESGKKVVQFPVEKYISFGDPFDLQIYQAWEDFFFNEEGHPYKG